MVIYLLKFTACLAILYFFYKVFLEKENMHIFKRVYLLASLAAALIIPALVFTEYVEVSPITYAPEQSYITNEITTTPIVISPALKADVLDIEPILWTVYFIGLAFFGIKFLKNLFQILRRIHGNPKQKWQQFFHVLLKEPLPPHTFLSYIFLNKLKFEANKIPKEVLLHEQTHARQKHSCDIIFVELIQVIFWVNPFVYLLKKSIKLNHEFLADQAVIKKGISQTMYQNTLLSYLSHDSFEKQQSTSIANAINYSSIKKRFNIMKTKTSKKAIVFRSVLLLPLMAMLLFGFSQTKLKPKEPVSIQTVQLELFPNEKIKVEEELVPLNRLSEKLNRKFLNTYTSKETTVQITSKETVHMDFINRVSKEIKKTGITGIEVFADEVVMAKSEYQDQIEISPESIILKANRISFDEHAIQINDTQDNFYNYNTLAKKYNAVPIDKRIIPLKDLKILERIYSQMTNEQKAKGQPFPECLLKNKQEEIVLIAEVIEIRINKNGQLLFKNNIVTLDELGTVLKRYNSDLSKKQRETIVAAIIFIAPDTPKKSIETVTQVLKDYGTATIDIKKIAPPAHIPSQDSATRKEMTEYNKLAKHYNSMSKNKMKIYKKDVERLGYLFSKMSDKQKADAEPFPDFPEPPPAPRAPKVAKGASSNIPPPPPPKSPKSVTSKNNTWTVSTAANRDSRVTVSTPTNPDSRAENKLQAKDNALPTPPPLPAIAIDAGEKTYSKELNTSISKYLEKNMEYETAVAEFKSDKKGTKQELWNLYNEAMALYVIYYNLAKSEGHFMQPMPANEAPRPEQKTSAETVKVYRYSTQASFVEEINLQAYTKALGINNAQFYFEGKKITEEEGLKIIKNNKNIKVETIPYTNKQPEVKIYKAEKGNAIPAPPTPPTPMAPLDHVIAMAKKEAQFFYEGENISSDKAIALLKNNKDLNIDSRTAKGKRPVVRISAFPISID